MTSPMSLANFRIVYCKKSKIVPIIHCSPIVMHEYPIYFTTFGMILPDLSGLLLLFSLHMCRLKVSESAKMLPQPPHRSMITAIFKPNPSKETAPGRGFNGFPNQFQFAENKWRTSLGSKPVSNWFSPTIRKFTKPTPV